MVEVLSKVSHLIRCANGRNRFTFGGVGWFAENNFVRGGVVVETTTLRPGWLVPTPRRSPPWCYFEFPTDDFSDSLMTDSTGGCYRNLPALH